MYLYYQRQEEHLLHNVPHILQGGVVITVGPTTIYLSQTTKAADNSELNPIVILDIFLNYVFLLVNFLSSVLTNISSLVIHGQESPRWISLFKLVTFQFFENILKPHFFGKIDWSMNSGQRRAGDRLEYLKENISLFQNSTKKWYQS